jgi:hypothetical protein
MFLPFPVVLLGAQLAMPIADKVPEFDVMPSCHGASQAAISNRDLESCLQQERDARSDLGRDWAQFPSGDRTTCEHSTSMGGIPSYVEMLTCLEIARDARNLPSTTTGSATRP